MHATVGPMAMAYRGAKDGTWDDATALALVRERYRECPPWPKPKSVCCLPGVAAPVRRACEGARVNPRAARGGQWEWEVCGQGV